MWWVQGVVVMRDMEVGTAVLIKVAKLPLAPPILHTEQLHKSADPTRRVDVPVALLQCLPGARISDRGLDDDDEDYLESF